MLDRIKSALYNFSRGRYGVDTLSTVLLILAIALTIINALTINNVIITVIALALLCIEIGRTYSRDIQARSRENEKFLSIFKPFKRMKSKSSKQKNDKDHKYFYCPNCKQMVRVPKGRGKIVITCPKCKTKFEKRT